MISSCWPSCFSIWQNVVWTAEVPGLWDFKTSTSHMRDLGLRKRITFSNIWKEECRIGCTYQVRSEHEEQGVKFWKTNVNTNNCVRHGSAGTRGWDSNRRVALRPSLHVGKHIQWKYRAEPLALNSGTNKGFEVLLNLPVLPLCVKAFGSWNWPNMTSSLLGINPIDAHCLIWLRERIQQKKIMEV